MVKFLAYFLASYLITTTVTSSEISNSLVTKLVYSNSRSLYKNINQEFYNHNADVYRLYGGSNQTHYSPVGIVFFWTEYANTWDEFTYNYGALNLTVKMELMFNKYNVQWSGSNLNIPLRNIYKDYSEAKWFKIKQIDNTTTQWARWDATHGTLSYNCWFDSRGKVLIRFRLSTYASNHYDDYYCTVKTERVICNPVFDYNTIYGLLNQNVNNQTIDLASNYSTSLQDPRNWPLINERIQALVAQALGSYYQAWKAIIYPNQHSPYAYDDNTNQVTLPISFTEPNTKRTVNWIMKVNIKLSLSGKYWNQTLQERLRITPGKVIDTNGNMAVDQPIKWNKMLVYSTAAQLRFTGNPDDSETMSVNGQPVQVIDHIFTYNMSDQQEHTNQQNEITNQYDVLLQKHSLNDFSKIIGQYEITFLIKQNIPQLNLKWHAWAPDKNPDQQDLISPVLPNGKRNPKYDREVNPKTGTKTQIIWVKHQAETPFPLDPLNQQGEIITNDQYDQGFIAEGSVSGMGIEQTFNDSWIKKITRESVNNNLIKTSNPVTIKSNNQGSYFSPSGTYHYTIIDQKGFTANKFILIGQNYQNKYAKFLDVLNDSNVAVNFWTSPQGWHLKHYLINEKQLDRSDIEKLTFEQVASYWKEYVSDVKSQRIPIIPTPNDVINLNQIELDNLKMNASDIKTIKNNILNGYDINSNIHINGLIDILQAYGLEKDIDYQINGLDDANLKQLLNFNNNGNSTITISINALTLSTKALGTTKVTIINLQDSLENAVDLSQITFNNFRYNFSDFTTTQLRNWILQAITENIANYPYLNSNHSKIILQYQIDYGVKPLDVTTLQKFLTSQTITNLKIIISALNTNRAVNSASLTLTNDPNAQPAPPEPPSPKPSNSTSLKPSNPTSHTPPNPDSNPNWFSKGKNLAWFLPVTIISCGGLVLLGWWLKIRKNKKIK